jgi:LVIVD repeat
MHTKHAQKGSLIIEAMVAIALMASFTVSALSLVWGVRILGRILSERQTAITAIGRDVSLWLSASSSQVVSVWFDDATSEINPLGTSSPISTLIHDPALSFGSSSCDPTWVQKNSSSSGSLTAIPFASPSIYRRGPFLGADTVATDIAVHNGFVYLTTDSAVQARHDFFIYDDRNPASPLYLSSIHTGPGLSALTIAGNYAYGANKSSTAQLQVIDISNRSLPTVVGKLKLPLPNASSTAPSASAVAYADGKIFLGTEKWDGPEFAIIDITYPYTPTYVSGIEIGSVVKNIVVRDHVAYVATAGSNQLIAIDVRNLAHPQIITSASPTGSAIEVGNRLLYHHGLVWFGRSGGGFNTSAYQELFAFQPASSSATSLTPRSALHVAGGIYGMAVQDPYVFIATGDSGGWIEAWKSDLSAKVGAVGLGILPVALACDGHDLYVATPDNNGFIRISP